MTGSYTLLNCEGLGNEKCGCRWKIKEQKSRFISQDGKNRKDEK